MTKITSSPTSPNAADLSPRSWSTARWRRRAMWSRGSAVPFRWDPAACGRRLEFPEPAVPLHRNSFPGRSSHRNAPTSRGYRRRDIGVVRSMKLREARAEGGAAFWFANWLVREATAASASETSRVTVDRLQDGALRTRDPIRTSGWKRHSWYGAVTRGIAISSDNVHDPLFNRQLQLSAFAAAPLRRDSLRLRAWVSLPSRSSREADAGSLYWTIFATGSSVRALRMLVGW